MNRYISRYIQNITLRNESSTRLLTRAIASLNGKKKKPPVEVSRKREIGEEDEEKLTWAPPRVLAGRTAATRLPFSSPAPLPFLLLLPSLSSPFLFHPSFSLFLFPPLFLCWGLGQVNGRKSVVKERKGQNDENALFRVLDFFKSYIHSCM